MKRQLSIILREAIYLKRTPDAIAVVFENQSFFTYNPFLYTILVVIAGKLKT
ncbi:MAG: hypothetical protein KAI83_10155 [Thiomargarita sp.]|nr:hypothetical protein [Thiomargarita sp.]